MKRVSGVFLAVMFLLGAFAPPLNGLIGGATALAERPDLRPVRPTVRVPTLIIVGLEDSLTPIEQSQMLNAGIPGSLLAIIPQSSHAAIAERADAANAAILSAARTGRLP